MERIRSSAKDLGKLTLRERRFVLSFVGAAGGNGSKAALMAGYSVRTARIQASQLLTKLNIQAAIKTFTEAEHRRAVADAQERDRILTQIIRDESAPVGERIRAMCEMNRCAGRHAVRHHVRGKTTLEDILSASRRPEAAQHDDEDRNRP